ncbi:MAG: PCMD domain-containing protein [Hyphomicrobiales bacterium]
MKKLLIVLFISSVALVSCKKDDKELSKANSILKATLKDLPQDSGINSEGDINNDNNTIVFGANKPVTFPLEVVIDLTLSEGAKSEPVSGTRIEFKKDEATRISVKAEDGTARVWEVSIVEQLDPEPQLVNNMFQDWYKVTAESGFEYYQPGKDANSIWATPNLGTSFLQMVPVSPIDVDGKKAAQIMTIGGPDIAPIIAGAMYTGKFDLSMYDPKDPSKAAVFGTPFFGMPKGIKFTFKYKPGPKNYKGSTELPYPDKCHLYAILENRNVSPKVQIAKAEYSGSKEYSDFVTMDLTFNYTSTDRPTHITVVLTSSINGDLFEGAIGSVLVAKEATMIYE